MAELLIRVVDKVNDNLYLDCQCTKRGDVIVVCPDGWVWSKEERTNPDWRIVSIPKMSVSEATVFLAPEPAKGQTASRTLQRRAFKFDLDRLPAELKAGLDDTKRTAPVQSIDALALADVEALKVVKPAIPDPFIIGEDRAVIG